MSNNVTRTSPLNIADLSVGDTLIRVQRHGGSWGSDVRRVESEVTVTKVLKTRLVVTDAAGRETRLLVNNEKYWPRDNGNVKNVIEGVAHSYHNEGFNLYTADDVELLISREADAKRNLDNAVKREATETLEAFKRELTVDNAEAAIAALQAFVANKSN